MPWIDNIMHFWGGGVAAMGMIWWTFYSAKISVSTKNLPKFYAAIIILGFTALVGVFWEFYELIIDRLITKNNYISLLQQGGLLDTLKDLFVDILGERRRWGDFFMKEKNNSKKIKISFFGGTEEVTGSNYLVEIDGVRGKTRILVDCGLFQGSRVSEEKNSQPFPYKPSFIDALLVTHAHLDHVGRIPKLVKEGFRGKIYSTYPTKDFAKIMLIDSIGVLSKEAKRDGKNFPIYQEEDVDKAMSLWEAKNYRESFEICGVNVLFKDAGHILGSAMIEITNSESFLAVKPPIGGLTAKKPGFYRRLGQFSRTAY